MNEKTPIPVDFKALFLGPKGENADLAEQMLLNVYRDYVFWRRNFHPEDHAAIRPEDQRSQSYERCVGRFQRELFTLLGELKSDIPFYSPRYIGHMLADTSLPAMVGYIATLLYNPNNIAWEGSLNILQQWDTAEHMTPHESVEYVMRLLGVLGIGGGG